MTVLKNMKIKSKLLLGFGLLLIIKTIITVYSANRMLEIHNQYAAMSQALADQTWQSFILMMTLTVIGLVLGVIIALVISGSISKPVARLVSLVEDVVSGKLHVNIDRSSLTKDEVGVLTRDVYDLVDTIRNIIGDLVHFTNETDKKGDIDFRIDASKYQGEYREMVESINGFADDFIGDMLTLLGVIDNISQGNFHVEMEKMPGKKIMFNEHVDSLREKLEGVSDEIASMIESAADKGNLSVHIDENRYEGGWRDILKGLNHIAEAVDAPIVEIRDVINHLSRGDFHTKITGNYAGDFLSISNATNNTIDILEGYITEITEVLTAVAGGDLTRNITREYVGEFSEIKNSINHISDTLRKAMEEISSASTNILLGAEQISTSASDLASGSTSQATSLEELHTSVETINLQTQQFAENSKNVNILSTKSTTDAKKGSDAMNQMMVAMSQIKESSGSISAIIKTIQDIAFQTNLLSLNASVEAARAGEHGKGFAVVAEEVRNLAARSQAAATESTSLIEDSIAKVDAGVDIADVTSDSLKSLVEDAVEVTALINNISQASSDQAEMIAQVSTVLWNTANTVQSNVAFSEESAAAAEELNSQAELLRQLVSYFKL